MNEMIVNKAMKSAVFGQSATTPAAGSPFIIHAPRCRWAVGAIPLPTARQLTANRAGGTAKKPTDALLAVAAFMLGKNHTTFLAAEVLASSVHRNILSPTGSGC
jgi:hypothetical protein